MPELIRHARLGRYLEVLEWDNGTISIQDDIENTITLDQTELAELRKFVCSQ